jgi:23S rRNA (guanosine2251-2'-O)-methyltransferase|tara:strand:- start:1291 stop:2031 length:741 start_codon:yes stop_codon:yes gene_type:complete
MTKPRNHQLITIFGRKPVLEVLQSPTQVVRLHISREVRRQGIIVDILKLAETRDIEVQTHSKRELSYISKNNRQDQGVALDLFAPNLLSLDSLPETATALLLIDGVTNPQNLGIIIRSVAASPMHGLILPKKGCAGLGPLVYKASAGTLIKATIYQCDDTNQGLLAVKEKGFSVYGLAADGSQDLNSITKNDHVVFVLGNESDGMAKETEQMCDVLVNIPMANDVESINVSAAATLVAFHQLFATG